MAFNTNRGKQSFVATAGQTIFDFNFKIYNEEDIKVYLVPAGQDPNDILDILTYPTDYSVLVDGDDGGKVTLTTPATLNDTLVINRELPLIRDTSYVTNGDLKAVTLNLDQDYQTYLIIDANVSLENAIRLPQSAVNTDPVLPNVRPNSYIRWNANGSALENDETIPDAVIAAKLSETNSKASEDAAKASENAAKISETNSKNSEIAAKASEDAAKSSETISKSSELIAVSKASEASASATSAATSATTATTKASEASASATSASNSAATATTKASEASASATSASTSANQALTSRNQAETFAQQAQASALSVDANNIVHRTDDESIDGIKTFTSSPIVPTPINDGDAANKEYVDSLKTIATGTATFTAATNNINLTGIGIGVEIGDVVQINGAEDAKNNSEFTIEVITDANNVIVNQAHANKGTTKNVVARVGDTGVTVKLLAKWYNAPLGLGQGWVDVMASRTVGTTFLNNTGKTIIVSINCYVGANDVYLIIGGQRVGTLVSVGTGYIQSSLIWSVPNNTTYKLTGNIYSLVHWEELR